MSTPRPNGSHVLEQVVASARARLEERGIAVESQRYLLSPYFMEFLGLWLAATGLLLPVAILSGGDWLVSALAILAVAVPLLEVRFLRPTITALFRRPGQNLEVRLPAPEPCHEVILCAHLDSKTELLDHHQRETLLRLGRPAMVLALAAGLLAAVEGLLPAGSTRIVTHWLALLASLPVAAYGLGMGANLVGGRFSRRPSRGAVDNGAAVAVLLALAEDLGGDGLQLAKTSVTLLLTTGEEAQIQGARAYVRDRQAWPLPTRTLNLEVVGQNGGYLLWQEDGTAMLRLPVDPDLNRALQVAVEAETGERPVLAPSISSDAFAFLRQGIPAATLGSFDLELGERGLHSRLDVPSRLDPARLGQTVAVLSRFLTDLDNG